MSQDDWRLGEEGFVARAAIAVALARLEGEHLRGFPEFWDYLAQAEAARDAARRYAGAFFGAGQQPRPVKVEVVATDPREAARLTAEEIGWAKRPAGSQWPRFGAWTRRKKASRNKPDLPNT